MQHFLCARIWQQEAVALLTVLFMCLTGRYGAVLRSVCPSAQCSTHRRPCEHSCALPQRHTKPLLYHGMPATCFLSCLPSNREAHCRTINENADPDVRRDMETWLNRVVPEGSGAPWVHTDEGADDMPGALAH